jgi:hypothetical protein
MYSLKFMVALCAFQLWTPSCKAKKTCNVKGAGNNATDDAPEILKAFEQCGRDAHVIFGPETFYVNSVMQVDWLENVDIDIHGTLLVGSMRIQSSIK